MAESPVFEWVSDALERTTPFSRIQARGTVRLALKQMGLDAASVDRGAMRVLLTVILPKELAARNVPDPGGTCQELVRGLDATDFRASAVDASSPDEVFSRMFGKS